MCVKIFKKSTILSVFQKTDLISYNSDKVLKSLHKKLQKSMTSASTSSSIFLHTTVNTWSTSHNLSELHEYACDLYQTHKYSEDSAHFQHQFNYFLNTSLSRAIAGADVEEMLHELKQEMQEHAKWQSETRKVIVKDEVLTESEEAEHIRSRCMKEIEQARHQSILKERRGNPRKALKHKLDFLTALDNPHRSAPPSEWAVSLWIKAALGVEIMNKNE